MLTIHGDDGALRSELEAGAAVSEIGLAFYRDESVLIERDGSEPPGSYRASFVRDGDGRVARLSYGGCPYARQRQL